MPGPDFFVGVSSYGGSVRRGTWSRGVMSLFFGKSVYRVVACLVMVFVAVACRQQQAPPEEDEGELTLQSPSGQATGTIEAGRVIEHLKANQLPIGRTDVYNAENDPSKRLGRPGEYIGKAVFHDTRHPLSLLQGQDVISFQSSGGVVETFSTVEHLETRKQTLEAARRQFPGAPPEYQYSNGVILLRLGHVLTPDQAKQYETALASFRG